MANPFISPGTLNRLLASIVIPNFTALNITPSFLGRQQINISFGGAMTTMIDAATGVVTSPEPYVQVNVTAHLLMSQEFADRWKRQMENSTLIGDITVRPVSPVLTPYLFTNAAIAGLDPLDQSGASADFALHLAGTYYINNSLWP